MDLGLTGARAFVLAASGGIGLATATELAREGATVVISSSDASRLERATDTIRARTDCVDDAVDWVRCDLTDPESVESGTRAAIDRLGGLDVLVTNHGGPDTAPMSELSMSDFDAGYTAILRSTILSSRVALPALADDGGAITNLVGIAALEPGARGIIGTVFRAGIYGFAKSLSEEVGPRGVRVNCVCPRGVETDRIASKLNARAERKDISRDDARAERVDELPLDHLGSPETFGRTAAFVSSPSADYMTGAVVPVDGGWHRHAF